MIKLIAFDLDGTVIKKDQERTISENVINSLEEALKRGIIIVPATGRPVQMLPEPIRDIKGLRYVLTGNGSAVADLEKDEFIYKDMLSKEKAIKVIECLESFNIKAYLIADGKLYSDENFDNVLEREAGIKMNLFRYENKVDGLNNFISNLDNSVGIQKIDGAYVPPEIRQEVIAKLMNIKGVAITTSMPNNIEINKEGVSKGKALNALCDILKIKKEETMAIGDGENDIEMMEYAGISVAMGNSTETILEAAKYKTSSVDEDGAADAIKKFALM